MKRNFTISLQHRLALTYTLFIGAALGILTLAINRFTGITFNALIKENISEKSGEIVRAIEALYNPMIGRFDDLATEAIGMYFVHEGYIVTVEDEWGEPVWEARSCDMQQCVEVINDIALRMEQNFRLNGGIQQQQYPVHYAERIIGTVRIETYGPFFYSETETQFLASTNRLLFFAGLILALLSAVISLLLSRSIAKPVLKATEAARKIAQIHAPWTVHAARTEPAGGANPLGLIIRIDEQYKTRELQDLSRSINRLAAELEEGERRQKQLTADIAHELRTPLTCLQGNIEAMIDGVYQPDKEHLESCHEEIIRLNSLVQDLNILTSLERAQGDFFLESSSPIPYGMSKNLNKTNFDLSKLVQIIAEQFKAAANEKGITLNLHLIESPINADYDRLKQVLVNLLSNAVKYTDSGSITIGIEKGSLQWDIVVADTGIGIPEKDIPHIFERFYRTDKSRSRSTGGAGIGLAIAAAIISAHGGTISVESKSGEAGETGSVFRVGV
ncbi:MAG: HAMP domain-containing histidine kinase [Spirochaetaceae bacterium]|jgi:signal transduction histidine kinase|nr:HAMP domain-containing histidine kinase [Spirochaetaceae bacterium]